MLISESRRLCRNSVRHLANAGLESYHAQRNLLMSANFIVNAPTRTKQNANGQAKTLDAEVKDVTNGEGIVDVKPIAPEVTG